VYLKTNCENKKPYQLGNYPCQLGLFPYFLPKTHSWYYPIIRDFSLFIRQKSLIVMLLLAYFSQKAASIFTAKFFMNFPQILKRFHRFFFGFSECFVYVLLSMYFVYIYTLFLLNFDWIIWTNYRRRRHAQIPSQNHAKSSKKSANLL